MVEYLPDQTSISNSIDSCVEEEDDTTCEAGVLNKFNASGTPLVRKLALKPLQWDQIYNEGADTKTD